MNDWKKYRLSDIVEIIGGGTPKTTIQEYWNGDIPWLSVGDYNTNHKYVYETERKISNLGQKNSSTKLLNAGDVIISARGTVGVVAMLGKAMAFNQTSYGIRAIEGISFNDFVYYLLKNTVENFLIVSYGAVFNTITRNTFNEIEICLPPLPEQYAIANVLSSLDDKIELLHRQNETLEALAQTLFRQWFIEEAEDDWAEKPLDEIADYLNGIACQKYPPQNEFEKLPVLKIKDLREGISDTSDWVSTNIPDEYIVRNGDVIFSWSGSLLVKIWDGDDCVLNQHLFKVTSSQYPKWFYYFWTKFHLRKFIMIAQSKSTTMGHIKRSDLSNSGVLVPSINELDSMDEVMDPLSDKLITNGQQIKTLEKLRDILLPKLISGEVRLKTDL